MVGRLVFVVVGGRQVLLEPTVLAFLYRPRNFSIVSSDRSAICRLV